MSEERICDGGAFRSRSNLVSINRNCQQIFHYDQMNPCLGGQNGLFDDGLSLRCRDNRFFAGTSTFLFISMTCDDLVYCRDDCADWIRDFVEGGFAFILFTTNRTTGSIGEIHFDRLFGQLIGDISRSRLPARLSAPFFFGFLVLCSSDSADCSFLRA